WRANGTGGVGLRETYSLLGKSIQVGRFVEAASVTGEVVDAEIICQNEHDVETRIRGFPRLFGTGGNSRCHEQAAEGHQEVRTFRELSRKAAVHDVRPKLRSRFSGSGLVPAIISWQLAGGQRGRLEFPCYRPH